MWWQFYWEDCHWHQLSQGNNLRMFIVTICMVTMQGCSSLPFLWYQSKDVPCVHVYNLNQVLLLFILFPFWVFSALFLSHSFFSLLLCSWFFLRMWMAFTKSKCKDNQNFVWIGNQIYFAIKLPKRLYIINDD